MPGFSRTYRTGSAGRGLMLALPYDAVVAAWSCGVAESAAPLRENDCPEGVARLPA